MPLVRISYPAGALTQAQKAQLSADLTDVVLDAEVDAVTEPGKMVTVIQFCEAAPTDWAVAGKLRSESDKPVDHFIVDVIVLEGLLEGARRTSVHDRVTEAFKRAAPADPMLAFRVWVLIHEVREGSWGAAGRSLSALDVAGFINSKLDPSLRAQIAAAVARSKA
jgi:phenylpyruvate tautomerase PptA (4-oxalocrotonate tautomerase family)